MPEEMNWKVGGSQGNGNKKARYAPKQKIEDGMSDSQRTFVSIFNDWHDVLTENGLMEDKKRK